MRKQFKSNSIVLHCFICLVAGLTACGRSGIPTETDGKTPVPAVGAAQTSDTYPESDTSEISSFSSGYDISTVLGQISSESVHQSRPASAPAQESSSFVESTGMPDIDSPETLSEPSTPLQELPQPEPPAPIAETTELLIPEKPEPIDSPIQAENPVYPAQAVAEDIHSLPIETTVTDHINSIGQVPGDVIKILSNLTVSVSQTNIQQSPIDVEHGFVYTANIEPGPDGDTNGVNLFTVLRQGTQDQNGNWQWTKATIEDRTIHDKWHTAPSVATDKDGYVHVVYNMHNFPWQYKTSTHPHDITNLVFEGQSVTQTEIERSKYENKTSFPTLGTAKIPGNQITYPAFFKDRNRDLYVSYRFAAKPARSFDQRTMSSGIARYDSNVQAWNSIGGNLSVEVSDFLFDENAPTIPTAIASQQGWTSYHPRLMFGPNNELYINWFWREGMAGAELSRPCVLKSHDLSTFFDSRGGYMPLPATPKNCGNLGYPDDQEFYSIGNSAMNSSGKPHIVLSPIGGNRQIVSYDKKSQSWISENSPGAATELFFDSEDTLWAISSGIVIRKRQKGSSSWETVYTDGAGSNCYPRAKLNQDKSIAYVHSHACNSRSVTIYALRLK